MVDSDLTKNFLTSMRGVTSTVTVISACSNQERHAMTATSVTSLSLDPPSMLVCVNKEASIHKILDKGSSFCINVLSNSQKQLAEICSTSDEGESRFQNKSWKKEDNFIFNEDSRSNILCECINTIDHTSHTIYIGKVIKVFNDESKKSLLYGAGNYIE